MSYDALVTRFVDALSVMLLLVASAAFVMGLRSLSDKEDLRALYALTVGGLALKASIDLLRPRGA